MATNGHALAKVDPTPRIERARGFEPTSVPDGIQLAEQLWKSGLLPDAIKSPAAAFAILAAGRELGIPPMMAMRSIFLVKGRVTLSADLAVSLVQAHPECIFFRPVELTDARVTFETQRKGHPSPTRLTWTMQDAQRAGITGNPSWKQYPRAMLRARCSMELARAVYPDALLGVYDHDELAEPQQVEVQAQVVPEAEPSHDAETGEVKEQPTNTPTFRAFAAKVRGARDGQQLAEAAHEIKQAFDGGALSPKQREKLKEIYAKQLEKLTDTEPPPPEDDAAEAEAEVMASASDAD